MQENKIPEPKPDLQNLKQLVTELQNLKARLYQEAEQKIAEEAKRLGIVKDTDARVL